MALSDLSSAQLQQMVHLVKEKESLQVQLARVKRSLDGLFAGNSVEKKTSGVKEPKVRRRRRRAALKDGLLKKLQAAGKDGLTIKELAASLRAKPASVSVWFYTTGKKIKGIKKVGKARFAYAPPIR
jgi:hypothetical protein